MLSSSSHHLDPGRHYILQALDVDLYLKSEVMEKDFKKYIVLVASGYPEHHDMGRMFGFHLYEFEIVLRLTPKHCVMFVLDLPS